MRNYKNKKLQNIKEAMLLRFKEDSERARQRVKAIITTYSLNQPPVGRLANKEVIKRTA